jgi:hypothetical protein
MTSQEDRDNARDEVLYAFHRAYERPSAAEIIEWVTRYPQFAEDIRGHAALARDWAAAKAGPVELPDESMLARGYSRVLNALYDAEIAAAASAKLEPSRSFQAILADCHTNVPVLAKRLDIGRGVLADLVNGGMRAPVGKRLVNAITSALGITVQAFDSAFQIALATPRVGRAKADSMPTIIPRSYEESVRSSNMTAERVQYWLSEE